MAQTENSKVLLVLLWLIWPVGLIWYIVDEKMRKDDFVRHHFKQWLVAIIVVAAGMIISGVLMIVLIGFLTYAIITVLAVIWTVQGIIYTVQGKKDELWIIGQYARKINL